MKAGLPGAFFFYGTLIAGSGNAAARAAHSRLRAVGPASASGALWAIREDAGWYPALVAGAGTVRGILYAAADDFSAEDLARLDAWEEYRPDAPRDSLYLREQMALVEPSGATVCAQVYRYNQPLPADAVAIASGDFAAWLQAHGYRAYAG